jgi:DNA excision repair protein ERCC-3
MLDSSNPLIVQSDKTVLLEVDSPRYEAARDALARFAELVKAPEHVHTYRLTPLSLWNAAASGLSAREMLEALEEFSKWPLPPNVRADLLDSVARYGKVRLEKREGEDGGEMWLVSDDDILITEIEHHKSVQPFLLGRPERRALRVDPARRGHLKQALIKIGFPVEDLAGYVEGAPLEIELSDTREDGTPWHLRDYQRDAVEGFWAGGAARGGSGVVVLPCGAGKTLVGLGAMSRSSTNTLIVATNIVAARQWAAEIADKTSLPPEAIGEYSGEKKEIRPVTVTTYQCLSYRRRASKSEAEESTEEFPHLEVFGARDWGLIIYDEVHLLPAPVFRVTAEIQARRRLGLTATLVREDGREDDVFSLIGPRKYDVPWRDLEKQGWIASAECHEIRLPLPAHLRTAYAVAPARDKYAIAACNEDKIQVAAQLVERHRDDRVLIIGQYLEQLEALATHFQAPLVTGKTKNSQREALFEAFRTGEQRLLIVSKVANFSLDLPEANVAIQVSGTFGSRQEEAQRLGRILRPKRDGGPATFYTLVTRDTRDQEFAANRQIFLTEQGYRYNIRDAAPPASE